MFLSVPMREQQRKIIVSGIHIVDTKLTCAVGAYHKARQLHSHEQGSLKVEVFIAIRDKDIVTLQLPDKWKLKWKVDTTNRSSSEFGCTA